MPAQYHIPYTLELIAGSATFLRASLQPKATVFDRLCDGTALLCLLVLLVLSMRLTVGLVL